MPGKELRQVGLKTLLIKVVKILGKVSPVRILLRKFLSFTVSYNLGLLEYRASYAHIVFESARSAKRLGYSTYSLIEFGVANGRGLFELENIVSEVSRELDISIEIYGFDSGIGMIEINDYRDLPHLVSTGFFKMNENELRENLRFSQLVIGDVSETVPSFFTNYNPAPIGAVVFDLDTYKATVSALRIFSYETRYFLPRVWCFFDDIVGTPLEFHNSYTGGLAAIRDFNLDSSLRKLDQVKYPLPKISVTGAVHSIYGLHVFDHPMTSTYLGIPDENL